ncbi:MAG: sel1 repeat family protein [Alphaproteobacteria bacterium]|nr:sel1 repeat family protein [Alphaproteobacteria bacterium]
MRKIVLGLALLGLLFPAVAHADLASAEGAYDRGDFHAAFEGFQSLAEQGSGFAKNRLGELYRDGKGTDQNYEEAAAWFRKAADDGFLRAYWNLGRMYEEGLGLEQDYVLAFKWYYLGRTSTQNALALRQLKSKLSPVQKAETKNLARDLARYRPSFGGILAGLRL